MSSSSTLITNESVERAQMIMSESFGENRWRRPTSALAMINNDRVRSLRLDREQTASCLQGAQLLAQIKQIKDVDASFVMGGHYATDGTFPTRWGTRPGSPPV